MELHDDEIAPPPSYDSVAAENADIQTAAVVKQSKTKKNSGQNADRKSKEYAGSTSNFVVNLVSESTSSFMATATPNSAVPTSNLTAGSNQLGILVEHVKINDNIDRSDEHPQNGTKRVSWLKLGAGTLFFLLAASAIIIAVLVTQRSASSTNKSTEASNAASNTTITTSTTSVTPTSSNATSIVGATSPTAALSERDLFFTKPFMLQSSIDENVCLDVSRPNMVGLCPAPGTANSSAGYAFMRNSLTNYWSVGLNPSLCIGRSVDSIKVERSELKLVPCNSFAIFPIRFYFNAHPWMKTILMEHESSCLTFLQELTSIILQSEMCDNERSIWRFISI